MLELVWSLDCTPLTRARPGVGSSRPQSPIKVLASEPWRRRAIRGGHTRLASPTEAYLVERGGSDAAANAVRLDGPAGAPPAYFDVLDVCSGPHAPLTQAASDRGLVVGPRIDKQRRSCWNILDDNLFSWLAQLISAGRVLYLHLGPPRATFSVARKPSLRSVQCP